MSDNLSEAKLIISDLYNEFLSEEKRLNEICDSHSVKIDEIDHKIAGFRKNDDIDYKVFSPRNHSTINTEKISELESQKESLENEREFSLSQLQYYSDKVHKFEKILALLNISLISDYTPFEPFIVDNEEASNKTEKIDSSVNNSLDDLFRFDNSLDDSDKLEDDGDENIDKVVSNIDSLFKNRLLSSFLNNESDDDLDIDESSDNIESVLDDSNAESSDNIIDVNESESMITPGQIAHIIHKVEFTSKIISNDRHRAKIELNEIVCMLKNLIK